MKRFWIILISFVLTAVIVGGGTYYLTNAKATKDKDALQTQINDLNTKVADAEKTLADAEIKAEFAKQYAGWQTFTSKDYGVSFQYPKSWPVARAELVAKDDPIPVASQYINLGTNVTDANFVMRSVELTKISDYSSPLSESTQKIKGIFDSRSTEGIDKIMLPPVNARIWNNTKPEYLETPDGSFRGIVYFANIGQDYSFNLNCIILLTDGKDKIFQLEVNGTSTKTAEYSQKTGDMESLEKEYGNFISGLTTQNVEQPIIKEYVDNLKLIALSVK